MGSRCEQASFVELYELTSNENLLRSAGTASAAWGLTSQHVEPGVLPRIRSERSYFAGQGHVLYLLLSLGRHSLWPWLTELFWEAKCLGNITVTFAISMILHDHSVQSCKREGY